MTLNELFALTQDILRFFSESISEYFSVRSVEFLIFQLVHYHLLCELVSFEAALHEWLELRSLLVLLEPLELEYDGERIVEHNLESCFFSLYFFG